MADIDQHSTANSEKDAAPLESSAEAAAYLFREHNNELVGYLTNRLRSVQEAKEVAQEAYVRLLQVQEPASPSLFRAYLFRTATNIAIDRLRHRTVRQRAEQGELFQNLTDARSELGDPAKGFLAHEGTDQLLGFLGELPAKCREAFNLHRLEGFSQRDVSKRLGFSERMVRRYVTYARCIADCDWTASRQIKRGKR